MATALIFAGGTGQRLNDRGKPKQFLEIHGKPIIIYTLEHFENHPDVDSIVVVCLKAATSGYDIPGSSLSITTDPLSNLELHVSV